jgi:sporulation protein YlmC with PRC-barrel domain
MMNKTLLTAILCITGFVGPVIPAQAQVAGSMTLGVSVAEMTRIASGWSVKKSIIGKTIYNESGQKIGKVEDLIIAPDKTVSYLIIGAGGFIGIGRHDVAIPMSQIREQDGRIVLPGATRDAVKALPPFSYADDTTKRDQFVAGAEQDIAKAKAKMAELDKRATAATGEAKLKLDQEGAALKQDLKVAEEKLAEVKIASIKKWKALESEVKLAIVRLQQRLEKATA